MAQLKQLETTDTQLGFESYMAQLKQLAAQQHTHTSAAHKFASTTAQQLIVVQMYSCMEPNEMSECLMQLDADTTDM